MSIVDARFAGGAIEVTTSTFVDQDVVRLELPGHNPVPLFPREARELADALIAAALDTEPPRELRRPYTADDALKEADA